MQIESIYFCVILCLQICLYDVRVDIYVSGSIAESGSWEGNMGKFLHSRKIRSHCDSSGKLNQIKLIYLLLRSQCEHQPHPHPHLLRCHQLSDVSCNDK